MTALIRWAPTPIGALKERGRPPLSFPLAKSIGDLPDDPIDLLIGALHFGQAGFRCARANRSAD
uniref:Uncharacterized protein n=1 Tax=Rhizobium leguminosarum TaxID=384 RepID=A0A179BWT3_RHILE|nr:hypothetical protein A4U53_39120 [Rhizobium leguminosarum]